MKLKLGKDALFLSILTLITVLVWMAFDIYRALTRLETPRILKEQLTPLNPKLSSATIDKLEGRINYSPDRLKQIRETVTIEIEEEAETTVPLTGENVAENAAGQGATESGILE